MNAGRFVGYFALQRPAAGEADEWESLRRASERFDSPAQRVALARGMGGLAFAAGPERPGTNRELFVSAVDGGFAFLDGVLDDGNALRMGLGDPAVDDTSSLAALVLAAHRKWGVSSAERLFGDFVAIAWHPGAPLLCAVSPGGARWLYHRASERTLWFADHPEFLLDSERPRGDRTYFASLAQGCFSGHRTPFERVFRLRPGYALRADRAGVSELRWWQVPRPEKLRYDHAPRYRAQLRRTLQAAVGRRMHGHQRVCISLSAGIDSGAVAVCAGEIAKQTGVDLLALTFSTPEDPLADEAPAARQAAARLGFSHQAVTVDEDPHPLDGLLEMASRLPFPTGHVIFARPLAALARAASQWGATLLLNGSGGELHSGTFAYLLTLLRARRYTRLLGEVARWRGCGFRLRRQMLDVVAALRDTTTLDLPGTRKHWLRVEPVHPPADPSTHPMLCELERFLTQEAIGSEIHQALYAAHGVTTSAPHLDRRVIEFVLAVPLELRVPMHAGDLNKPLLRSAFPEISDELCRQGDRVNLAEHAARTWIRCAASDSFLRLFKTPSQLFDDVFDRARLGDDLVMLRQSSEEMRMADVAAAAIWLQAKQRHGVSLT